MKLLVISICKDEAKTIGEVLDRIPKNIAGITKIDKWVIDDGSSDNTVAVALKHGANVQSDGANKKLAFRFREALDIALNNDADILLNIDGDLQFDPADIPILVKPIVEDKTDFVAADRFTNIQDGKAHRPKNMPAAKYWGNRAGAKIVSQLSKHNFNDVTCGFRAYNRKAMIALNTSGTYTYTQESFQVLAMKRIRIMSLPVKVTYFPERKSRVVTSTFKYMSQSAVNILRSYRDFAPLSFFTLLGAIPFVIGTIGMLIAGIHWATAKQITPYKGIGIAGIYLFTLGIIIWIIGLLADMLSRMLSNQEKIIELTREIKYNKRPTKK
ncbi:MAG TPA: glycosyltransferase family 2 protein [Patescibacteria group bacterium]|nr:glycosyltransferase family 2 protein [Patescibacteria group bacterium]